MTNQNIFNKLVENDKIMRYEFNFLIGKKASCELLNKRAKTILNLAM